MGEVRDWLRWSAPFTLEQIGLLNRWQGSPHVHPYTCGNNSSHPRLVATIPGWICLACDYTQTWAHPVYPYDKLEDAVTEPNQWTIRPHVDQSYGVWGTTGKKMYDLLADAPPTDRLQRRVLRTLLKEAIDRLEEQDA